MFSTGFDVRTLGLIPHTAPRNMLIIGPTNRRRSTRKRSRERALYQPWYLAAWLYLHGAESESSTGSAPARSCAEKHRWSTPLPEPNSKYTNPRIRAAHMFLRGVAVAASAYERP